jgi:hypothetical protein
MKVINFLLKKNIYFLILLSLVMIVFFIPILNKDLIINSDWSFPETREQLYFFSTSPFSLFTFKENILGSYVGHQNDYFFRFFGLISFYLGFDGISFQKLTIFFLLIFISYFSKLLFFEIYKNQFKATFASIIYIFSPVYFDFYTMGWIYVILYYSFQPLIFYCLIKFHKTNSYKYILILFVLTPILFSQSQSPLWIVIILFAFCVQKLFEYKKFFVQTIFFLKIFFIICISIIIANFSWILIPNEVISSNVSQYDMGRFSEKNLVNILSYLNNIHNKFYLKETFLNGLSNKILSLILIIILLLYILFSKKNLLSNYYIFSIVIFFSPLLLFLTYSIWIKLPFSTVFRDVARFNVVGYLGFTILLINIFSLFNNRIYKLILIALICSGIYPFLDLYNILGKKNHSFLRFFSFEDSNLETQLNKDEKNIIIPTGGHLKLFSDNTKYNFYSDYFEIGDSLSFFSPKTVNFFTHDKAPIKQHLLTNFYIYSYFDEDKKFYNLNKIFGINNIFFRKDALSAYNNSFGTIEKKNNSCDDLEEKFIYQKCEIKDAYNEIYTSDEIYFSNFIIIDNHFKKEKVSQLNCDEYFKKKYNCNNNLFEIKSPKIEYYKKSDIYTVKIYDIDKPFLLNLNRSFSKSWKIRGNFVNNKHIEANSFVNSWLFYPDKKINLLEIQIFNEKDIKYKKNFRIQIILYLRFTSVPGYR